ncbi:chromosome segregation protein Spc25-domain-containing protein [Entophlyctis helioformis]|nr:chromosome segregation protein Spc25-domain-containing protein [Entophlyctis helioformis]
MLRASSVSFLPPLGGSGAASANINNNNNSNSNNEATTQPPRTPAPLRDPSRYDPLTPGRPSMAAAKAAASVTAAAAVSASQALGARQAVGGLVAAAGTAAGSGQSAGVTPAAVPVDVKTVCASFLQQFEAWTLAKHSDMTDARAQFVKDVKDLAARRNELAAQLESIKSAEADSLQQHERQRKEQTDMEAEIAQLAVAKASRKAELDSLHRQADEMHAEIQSRRQALEDRRRERDDKVAEMTPDLEMYERMLSMRIFTSKSNIISFVFTHINEMDYDKEYSFELGVSDQLYLLVSCKPMLPNVDRWMEWLNSTRDLYPFIKAMRRGFVAHVAATKSSRSVRRL